MWKFINDNLDGLFIMGVIVALIGVLIVVSSCAAPNTNGYGESPRILTSDASVRRWIDREAGVVCWIYTNSGISCLPLAQTSIPQ